MRVVEVLALVYVEVATCDAVIVVVPDPITVMRRVLELIVATAALELVYEIAPLLFEVGAVNVNAAESWAFVMAAIAPSIGSRSTVSVVVTVVEL